MKKVTCLILLYIGCTTIAISQKNYQIKTIAFYNLENLFDTINDPEKLDEESPIMKISKGRNIAYEQKFNNMAKVLSQIGLEFTKTSPTIIGIAEIENRNVLEDLVQSENLGKYNYGIIHYNSPDRRGIDVALLYQQKHFTPVHHEAFELKLWDEKGYPIYTRDQLLVSGYLDNELIHIIVNHWPSRRGGELRSRHRREKAAFLNTQIIEKIKLEDPNPKIIIMGDFNDDPHNSSLKTVLNTKSEISDLEDGAIYNPMELLFNKGENTLVYRDNINLFDQILVSSPLVSADKTYLNYKLYKTHIFNPPYLITQTGKYKGYPFRSFSTSGFTGGYSDHYPVYIYLIREVQK